MSIFKGVRALSFLRLAKALAVSQPVKACSPIRLSHMLSPNWLWLPSNQSLQHTMHAKGNECLHLLVWTAAPPLPPIHLLSCWSRFLRRLHTMRSHAAYICIAVVSPRQPITWWGSSCWYNCTGIVSTALRCAPPAGICTEALYLHHQILWKTCTSV